MAEADVRAFQERQEQQEPPVVAAALAWIAALRAAATVDVVADAVATGVLSGLLERLRRAPALALDLLRPATDEATYAVDDLPDARQIHLRFDIRDPHFHTAIEQHGALAIREIDDETRDAVRRILSEAYRNGWHPRIFAPTIQQTIGLTSRQTTAVTNYYRAQVKVAGQSRAEERAARYAARLRRQRALLIARTETVAAMNRGRIAGFEQAAQHGLFDRSRAYLEWNAIQTDPKEICYQLNGTRVPLGSTWNGLLPGDAHPACRCVPLLVLE